MIILNSPFDIDTPIGRRSPERMSVPKSKWNGGPVKFIIEKSYDKKYRWKMVSYDKMYDVANSGDYSFDTIEECKKQILSIDPKAIILNNERQKRY